MNDLWISHFLLMTWSLAYNVPKIPFIITNIMLLLLYEVCVLFIPIGSAGRWWRTFHARGNGKFQFPWYWGHCLGLKDQCDQAGPSNCQLWGAAALSDTDKLNKESRCFSQYCFCMVFVWLFSYSLTWPIYGSFIVWFARYYIHVLM